MTEPVEPTEMWVLAAPTKVREETLWCRVSLTVLETAPGPFEPPPGPPTEPEGPPGPPTAPPGGTP